MVLIVRPKGKEMIILPENIKQAWHVCPYCRKRLVVYVSDKDNELEIITMEEYKKLIKEE